MCVCVFWPPHNIYVCLFLKHYFYETSCVACLGQDTLAKVIFKSQGFLCSWLKKEKE